MDEFGTLSRGKLDGILFNFSTGVTIHYSKHARRLSLKWHFQNSTGLRQTGFLQYTDVCDECKQRQNVLFGRAWAAVVSCFLAVEV